MREKPGFILIGFVLYAALLMNVSAFLWCLIGGDAGAFFDAFPWVNEPVWWAIGFAPGILVAATQFAFLMPVVRLHLQLQSHGRPLGWTLAMAAIVAGLGTMGLLLALSDVAWIIAGRVVPEHESYWALLGVVAGVLVFSWLLWIPLLARFCRRQPKFDRAGRLVGLLLGGTLAEIVVLIPVDILVRHRVSCYCSTATFHASWLASLALVWLTGPGLILAILARRRRAWRDRCQRCGYRRNVAAGPKCPECGHEW